MRLQDAVKDHGAKNPDSLAVRGPDGSLTYSELDSLANRIARGLEGCGVGKGERVAIWLEKSTVAVASMQAVMRLGAAYVPIDPLSPVARTRHLLSDCEIEVLVSTQERAAAVPTDALRPLSCLCVGGCWDGRDWQEVLDSPDHPLPDPGTGEDDLAYILYTSGSTGLPKGVCISHRNALAFVDWAIAELAIGPEDRLANHAPFHFDLSVFDLYAAFQTGAAVFLIPDGMSFAAGRLVEFLVREQLTVWYSVPSVLILMMEHGGLLDRPQLPLRAILFAGEIFPVKHLRQLRDRWPGIRYLNLYGPTETNVCTFHEVVELESDRILPVPIGRACSGDRVWVRKEDGGTARPGEEGELMVAGSTVMLGYWGREPQAGRSYATGDIVRVLEDGLFQFAGRRDHMVKVRGNRVELGEIEAVLQEHPAIRETAVVATGIGLDTRLVAFVVAADTERLSLLALKEHCAKRLTRYMIVDRVCYVDRLPRMRTGKVDTLSLKEILAAKDKKERVE